MRMREAVLSDLPGVYRVCLATGAVGADASPDSADPDLLGHLFAAPYVVADPSLSLVLEHDGAIVGYCIGTADTARFATWMDETWLPPLRARYPLSSGRTDADRRTVGMLHDPFPVPDLATEFAAHLHIDLLPQAQGRGLGRSLIDELARRLADRGASGVHLGVHPANSRALGFYERVGFERAGSNVDGSVWFVRRLGRKHDRPNDVGPDDVGPNDVESNDVGPDDAGSTV